MSFWFVVLVVLIGVPSLLLFTGMGMIFWSAGLAGGPQESRATTIVYGWLALACVLVAVFGAFGLAPAWRAWHVGEENFDGGLRAFVDWLVGVGIVGALAAAVFRAVGATEPERLARSPLVRVLRWLLLVLGFVPWAAFFAWVAWPLVMWPVRGSFEWPDAATGWTRTGIFTAILSAAMVVEEVAGKLGRR